MNNTPYFIRGLGDIDLKTSSMIWYKSVLITRMGPNIHCWAANSRSHAQQGRLDKNIRALVVGCQLAKGDMPMMGALVFQCEHRILRSPQSKGHLLGECS